MQYDWIEKVVRLYNAGWSIRRLARRFRTSRVKKLLLSRGVNLRSKQEVDNLKPVRGPANPLSDEQLGRAMFMYYLGRPQSEVARAFNVPENYLRKLFRAKGLLLKPASEAHRSYEIDEHVFDNPHTNPEAAYWIGVLFSDGCVMYNSTATQIHIRLGLSGEDGQHVYEFRSFLKSTHRVSYCDKTINGKWHNCKPVTRLGFNSLKIGTDLRKYGIVPRKSLTAKVSGGLEYSSHFWRGVVDGDGSVESLTQGNRRYPTVGICGSYETMLQFRSFALSVVNRCSKPYKNGKNCWRVTVTGSSAYGLLKVLYSNDYQALPRKKSTALKLIEEFADKYEGYHPRWSRAKE